MRTFFVLLWKHLLVRKRRFIQTPVEYLSPILFFLILFLSRDKFSTSKNFDKYNEAKITEPFTLDSTHARITRLLYAPSTVWTDQLMDEVGAKLGLSRLDHLPGHREKGYYPFTNASFTEEYFKSMRSSDAIILFQRSQNEDGSWPKNLDYTIRMKEDFNVDTYESFDGTHGPHDAFGAIYEPFMRLQWAVDTSYLHLLTGAEINQTLTLQEFPYSRAAESTAREMLCYLLNFLCPLSLMLLFVFLMTRLMEEKNSGILELVRMVGVDTGSMCAAHVVSVLPAGLVYAVGGALLLTGSDNPIVPNSSTFIIFLVLFLHFLTVVAFVFAAAYLINTTQYITTLAMFVFMVTWVPSRSLAASRPARPLLLLSGLAPHAPLGWCWAQVAAREKFGQGVTFSNVADSASRDHGSVLLALVFMLLQTALYFLLAWYFAQVRPGKYGHAMPWNFLFQKQYWSKNPKVETVPSDEIQLSNPEPQYFEPVPKGSVAGIQILDVTKRFPKHTALSNVTFDALQGEITVLVGHNGAGKTTLMNIIAGLMSPSSGRALLGAAAAGPAGARRLLGLCPQHNLFFPALTVLEHVMFFAMIKGDSLTEARSSAKGLLLKLNLADKGGSSTDQLSGGMKRRAQLACALAGGARVLVLDEPTSGLDVETRRELWDILLALRGERTVLLSTHFMEEADALGDRVCALHAGRLRAHATPMFLKRAVGTGYRVSLTTRAAPDAAAVTALVRAAVPAAAVRDQAMNTITYNLPAKDCSRFPELFAKLEENRSRLGIESIGVGKSTLDDVFLKLCSDVQSTPAEDEADLATPEITHQKLTGFQLYLRQFAVLMKRQYRYKLSKIWSFLFLQVTLPFVVIFLMTRLCNNEPGARGNASDAGVAMNLDLYSGLPDKRVLYNIQYDDVVPVLRNSYKSVKFEKATDVADAVFRSGKEDILEYNKYLVGIELNDTDAKALFTTRVRHAAPAALSLLSSALAARVAGARALTARNRPLRAAAPPPPAPPKHAALLLTWALYVGLAVVATLASDTALPARERAAGTRHVHYMCGCPRALHWAAALAASGACALLVLLLPTALAAVLFDTDKTIDQPDFLGAVTLTLLLGVPAVLAPAYLLSTALGERATSTIVVIAAIVFGFVTPLSQMGYETVEDTVSFVYKLLEVASYLFPAHTMTMALYKCTRVAGANALCALNRGLCALIPAGAVSDFAKCCQSSSNPESYFSLDQQAPGRQWLVLIAQFIVYWALLLLAEGGAAARAREALLRGRTPRAEPRCDDDMVRAEHAYVDKAIKLPKKQIAEAMLCHDVHKYYPSLAKSSCYAVKGISFSVKKGECFGLLGVNGAGKSTTFKMLTAEQQPTRGTLFANHHYNDDTTQYMRSLSYCPQFAGVDDFLTGSQNLELVLTLRGLPAAAARQQAAFWIQEVGLEAYASRPLAGYSGGCARRLAAAAALCQHARVAVLDEPTAGVDAAARRRLHRALRRARRSRALVVASHSMDEMEALCDRIGILAGGRLRALGSAPALRARHAAGHALALKLRAHDATDGGPDALSEFKGALHRTFEDCTLQDEHETMLHYHVRDALRYSELFARLEALRDAHPLLEDYSVNETTLEEVFLSFARDQRPAAV